MSVAINGTRMEYVTSVVKKGLNRLDTATVEDQKVKQKSINRRTYES